MRLLLVRHGQTDAAAQGRFQGQKDYPLNKKGKRQAVLLAPLLASFAPGRIFTSDLSRSIDTASPAAKLLQLGLCVSSIFREYCWGELEGLAAAEIEDRYAGLYPLIHQFPRRTPVPGQEDLKAFQKRIRRGLSLLLAEDCTVVLVGHGRYLNALTVDFLRLGAQGPWPFTFAPAALTILEQKGSKRRMILFNDQCHLTGEKNV